MASGGWEHSPGWTWNTNSKLYVINNTIVNDCTNAGAYVFKINSDVPHYEIKNNLIDLGDIYAKIGYGNYDWYFYLMSDNSSCTGSGTPYPCCTGSDQGTCSLIESNDYTTTSDPGFLDQENFDYHLTSAAAGAINQGTDPGVGNGFNLAPAYEYVHPLSSRVRPVAGALDIGAYEYGSSSDNVSPSAPSGLSVL
jgi:hypothetical protein